MTQTSRAQLIDRLNEDLAREYQAIIAYVIYSQVLKGAEYMSIARELETHAAEELAHALKISKHIDYLGGMPTTKVLPVKVSDDPRVMLRADLETRPTPSATTANASSSASCCTNTRLPKTSGRSCGRNKSIRSISPRRWARTCPESRSPNTRRPASGS